MAVLEDAERFEPATVHEWSQWLARNHDRAPGVWLVTPRRASGRVTLDYDTAVEEALRFGWIDATTRTLDDERSMQWFAPRKPRSGWAASNKRRVERLRAEGRMEPAGERAVQIALENGAWSMYDDVEKLVVPPDLEAALSARPGARAAWDRLSPSARRQALTWIVQARRPATRDRRVVETADRLVRGERPR